MDSINLRFMFFGFSAAWLIVIGYILILVSRGNKIERELGRLKSLLEDRPR